MAGEHDAAWHEAYRENPDWRITAQIMAEQPGCEDSILHTVRKIIGKPGELIVGVLPRDERFFAIGAMIAAKERPFNPLLTPGDDRLVALEIAPETKEYAPGFHMIAEREISFGLTRGEPGDISNYMGPGIHSRDGEPSMTILDARTDSPALAIGTDEVNTFFEELAAEARFATHKDRLVGMLFQTAWLAVDFNASVPTAPEALRPELEKAKEYYQTAQVLAQSIADSRKNIAAIADGLEHHSAAFPPAIHFEKPLDLPTLADVQKIQRSLAWPPSDNEVRQALQSYGEAITILDALSTD